jgi:hypothetical protein
MRVMLLGISSRALPRQEYGAGFCMWLCCCLIWPAANLSCKIEGQAPYTLSCSSKLTMSDLTSAPRELNLITIIDPIERRRLDLLGATIGSRTSMPKMHYSSKRILDLISFANIAKGPSVCTTPGRREEGS